jgi:SsrA-binding protein
MHEAEGLVGEGREQGGCEKALKGNGGIIRRARCFVEIWPDIGGKASVGKKPFREGLILAVLLGYTNSMMSQPNAKPKKGSSSSSSSGQGSKTIASNRKAYHEYEVLESLQAGLMLTGTEIKSLRLGLVSLQEAHARCHAGEIHLYGMNIAPYEKGSYNNHEPLRVRKLLLHRKEIDKLAQKVKEKGLTLVPLKLYFSRCWVKVEIGLCRGKKLYDKRDALKQKSVDRDLKRLGKQF